MASDSPYQITPESRFLWENMKNKYFKSGPIFLAIQHPSRPILQKKLADPLAFFCFLTVWAEIWHAT
jgi:hypothetical protein